MSVHFYTFSSRLGMINLPHRQEEFNLGVEEGGDAVLTTEFIEQFPGAAIDRFEFTLPEALDRKKYFETIAHDSQQAIALIEDTLQEDEMQVVVGGDHSVAFSSLSAILRRLHSHSVGYIQVDSHPDINTIATSPTGNFHGMWMRPFVGGFEREDINLLVPHLLKPSQVLYIGNLDLDPEESEFIATQGIRVISVDELRNHDGKASDDIKKFFRDFEHIHLDIDIDGFDQSVAPATGIPAQKGLLRPDIDAVLALFKKKESRSLDLVEVNPQKEGSDETIAFAQSLIAAACLEA